MADEISVDAKHDFVKWILRHTELRERGCVTLFRLLRDERELLKKIHFTDGEARYAPNGAIVSIRGVYTIPFRYFRKGSITSEVTALMQDIVGLEDFFYIQINLPQELKEEEYYNVIVECPYEKKVQKEDIKNEVEEFVNNIEKLGTRRVLLREIDVALDSRDKDKFDRLTNKLIELCSSLDNNE